MTKIPPADAGVLCDLLPYPAVLFSSQGEILHRNRAAQKLLPAPWKLKQYRKKWTGTLEDPDLFSVSLDGVVWFVLKRQSSPEAEMYLFLEEFMPLYEPLMKTILEETALVLGKWEDRMSLPLSAPAQRKGFDDRLSARTLKLRQNVNLCYRLFSIKESRATETKTVCDLSSWLDTLCRKIGHIRADVSFVCPEGSAVWVDPKGFLYAFLLTVQFVDLFEGQVPVQVEAKPVRDQIRLRFTFPDRERVLEAVEQLLPEENHTSLPTGCTFLLPLFAAGIVCRREGFGFHVSSRGEEGVIDLFVPAAEHIPQAFFGAKKKENDAILEQIFRQLFGDEEKM